MVAVFFSRLISSFFWQGWWAALALSWVDCQIYCNGKLIFDVFFADSFCRHLSGPPSVWSLSVRGAISIGCRLYIGAVFFVIPPLGSNIHFPFLSQRYMALFAWTVTIWVSYNVLINARQAQNASPRSVHAVDLIGRLLFSFFICAAVLLFEKFAIQWIAGKFHERSYAGPHFFFLFHRFLVDGLFLSFTRTYRRSEICRKILRHSLQEFNGHPRPHRHPTQCQRFLRKSEAAIQEVEGGGPICDDHNCDGVRERCFRNCWKVWNCLCYTSNHSDLLFVYH